MKSPLNILFVIDPIEQLDPHLDTTFIIMLEAQTRGHRVSYTTIGELFLEHDIPRAHSHIVTLQYDKRGTKVPPLNYQKGETHDVALEEFDVIFMRKDPPFSIEYVTATHLLSLAEITKHLPAVAQAKHRAKAGPPFIINSPEALRDFNEKLITLFFPDIIPPSLVTRDLNLIKKFAQEQGEIVIKPLDRAGGTGVIHIQKNDKNLPALTEILTEEWKKHIMAQQYIPEAVFGDKRIVLLNGEILGAVLRVPGPHDHRGNVLKGAHCEKIATTDRDREICEILKPWLIEHKIYFAGIDIIGDYLIEINITSPSCVREINALNGVALEENILNWIESI